MVPALPKAIVPITIIITVIPTVIITASHGILRTLGTL